MAWSRFTAGPGTARIDLTVRRGQVFGFLGPNGAGKTTTIRILATLARPDGGTARVLGFDVISERNAIRALVAVTGQFAALDYDLTGYENLIVFGRCAAFPAPPANSELMNCSPPST